MFWRPPCKHAALAPLPQGQEGAAVGKETSSGVDPAQPQPNMDSHIAVHCKSSKLQVLKPGPSETITEKYFDSRTGL